MAKKRTRNSEVDFDVFWKMFIENDFEDFMAFSYAKLHAAIDYSKKVEFLPKTLHKPKRPNLHQDGNNHNVYSVTRKVVE